MGYFISNQYIIEQSENLVGRGFVIFFYRSRGFFYETLKGEGFINPR